MGAAPGRYLAHVLLQPPIGLIDAAVEDQFAGPHGEPLGRKLREQRDRVMIELPPTNRIQVAEEVDYVGVPTPP